MKVMRASSPVGAGRRLLPGLALLLGVAVVAPRPVDAQYFGRNKVQYDDFDFRVLKTDHFDIHYYPEEAEAIEDLARMSERWYERLARSFQHEFEAPKPLIIYADHPDFQQTNTLRGFIGESTGGVTESLKNRIIMPMTGSYADTDHVLGHELVHGFQYNIAQSRRGGGLQGLGALPLWLIEGMAEYLSVGRDDPLTAMWLRDAVRREDFPTIRDMTRESRFFPYRFGQALWAYIGGEYGDAAVMEIFRRSLRGGFQPALAQVLGASADTLSVEWRRRVEQAYIPLMANRTDPDSVGTVILSPATGSGSQNVSPALSPDGRYLVFLSEKDLFSVDLFLADARTGKIIRKLASADADPHADAIRYVEASGAWSPDGERFAYTIFAEGDNEIVIIERESGERVQRIKAPGLGAINNPAWSPDGRYLAFTGFVGGVSDLYLWDLEDGVLRQLTNDKFADFQPTWSPDGRTLAFSTDRGPSTDFQQLTYSNFQLALLDVPTRRVEVLDVFGGEARHSNPQFAPDGRSLYFLSDQDGFSDIYRMDLDGRQTRRLTRVATGVSGITSQSPALSVARRSGELAFSVFTEFEFHIHTLPPSASGDVVATAMADADLRGRRLPPADPDRFSFVADYLADPSTGLPDAGTFMVTDATAYESNLELDYLGQPSIGVGTDRFGSYAGGGASAFFSDMLGNKFLGVAFQAQGTLKDIGGQVTYQDVSDRWNWAVGAGHIPYLLVGQRFGVDDEGNDYLGLVRQRVLITSGSGILAYPFSSTRRVEFGGGVVRYGIDLEEDRYILDDANRIVDVRRVNLDDEEADAVTLVEASAAYVGDNAFFGFTSPVRGKRFRLELQATQGDYHFLTAIADWRRYWQVDRNLTLAMRGLHYGRYGDVESDSTQLNVIRPLFLGFETLIRGYASESFDQEECIASRQEAGAAARSSCPVYSRLFGDRLGVVNLEARVPLLGVEQFGLINFPYLPTELVVFQDAGVAWSENESATLEFSRSSAKRVPVFSTGVGARFNILGFLILEAYYAKPWQRTFKGPHWGFVIAPGW